MKDRQEIRDDLKKIRSDRVDLDNDQAKVDGARRIH